MAVVAHFPFLVITIIAVVVAADDPQSAQVGSGCSPKTYSYVNATAFHENQDAVFTFLLSNLSSNGFATSTQNKFGTTDPVYGLAVCREYLTAHECSECVTAAETGVQEQCPRSNGGRIHLDGCFLRYENSSSFGWIGVDGGASANCPSTNDTDPQIFSHRASMLSSQLIANASANNGYAVGSIDGSLYGVAQCWPTLSNSSCQECLTNAQNLLLTCPPIREGRGLEAGCFMRYSTYSFFTDNETSGATPNLTPSSGKSSSKVVPILLGSIGATALVVVVCSILFSRHIRHRKNSGRTDENFAARRNFEQFLFDYEVLREVTGNFDRNNLLGKGGFGEVYKGTLPDGTDVAVKKLNGRQTAQAAAEFLTEVKLLTSVRHRNLVRLLGCCTQGHERLLVYEFMSNNSLHKHLFGKIRNALSWENRLNIIVGTARGLAYLHEDSDVRIIHRDIKCPNILLDDKFNAKIADFGLARLFPEGETHVSTRAGGTIGYTAPEYALYGQLTEKADVYSYGIVVLEIVCGRKCVDARLDASKQLLLEWAWNQFQHDHVLDIVDPLLAGQYPIEQLTRVIRIALLCTQGSSVLRPAMSEVVSMLTNNTDSTIQQPTEPALIGIPTNFTPTSDSSSSASASHGSITVSLFPR